MKYLPSAEAISATLAVVGWRYDVGKIDSVVFDLPCTEYYSDGKIYKTETILLNLDRYLSS